MTLIMDKVSPKIAFSAFKPEQIVFVISVNTDKKPSGMIAGWSMKCSFSPPLYAVALWEKGYTHKLIDHSKEFVIAVPNKNLEKAVRVFGTRHGDKVDKFKVTKLKTEKARFVSVPLLPEATINMECRVVDRFITGDHIVYIGEVLASYLDKNKKILVNMKSDKKEKWIFKEI